MRYVIAVGAAAVVISSFFNVSIESRIIDAKVEESAARPWLVEHSQMAIAR
jgi:hypothetical protein